MISHLDRLCQTQCPLGRGRSALVPVFIAYLLLATTIRMTDSLTSKSSSYADIPSLLRRLNGLTSVQQRAVASVVGSAVGDAATRPVHWLYDRAKLEATIGTSDPAFWPESISPYYTLPTGRRSCYNGEPMLKTRVHARVAHAATVSYCTPEILTL
jgi:hypothetical protein